MDIPPLEAHQRHLTKRIATICGHRNVADAQLVAVVAEAIETGAWFMAGIKSPEHFVAWQTGSSSSRAHHIVAVARRRTEFPCTYAAFERGELSLDQIATVAAHAPAWADTELAVLARNATVSQLRLVMRQYPWPNTPTDDTTGAPTDDATTDDTATDDTATAPTGGADDDPPGDTAGDDTTGAAPQPPTGLCLPPAPVFHTRAPAPPHDFFSLTFDEKGRFRLVVEGDALDGATIEHTVNEAHDRLFRAGHRELTWVDALVDVATRSLSAVTNPERVDRYRTYIHLDTNHSWLNAGPALPKTMFEHATCDGTAHPLWEHEGHPINIGRAHQIIPNHTRRLILDRDRTCRHPGCTSTRHLQVHHIIHWTNNGPTNTANLLALCPYHHRALHKKLFTITGNADKPHTLVFTVNGQRITHPGPRPPAPHRPTTHPATRPPIPPPTRRTPRHLVHQLHRTITRRLKPGADDRNAGGRAGARLRETQQGVSPLTSTRRSTRSWPE